MFIFLFLMSMKNEQSDFRREIQLTADGSYTLYIPEMDEHYHSVNGAIQESRHVFLGAGLHQLHQPAITVFEVGFGTGLNAFLTLLDAEKRGVAVVYYSIELYPLSPDLIRQLNYGAVLSPEKEHLFFLLHEAEWEKEIPVSERFTLHKMQGDLNQCVFPVGIDLVYFDAFAPDKQPEVWNQSLFERLYAKMAPGGVLTTYCAKGVVRRMMHAAGFRVERIPGPPGKREMLRATKEEQ